MRQQQQHTVIITQLGSETKQDKGRITFAEISETAEILGNRALELLAENDRSPYPPIWEINALIEKMRPTIELFREDPIKLGFIFMGVMTLHAGIYSRLKTAYAITALDPESASGNWCREILVLEDWFWATCGNFDEIEKVTTKYNMSRALYDPVNANDEPGLKFVLKYLLNRSVDEMSLYALMHAIAGDLPGEKGWARHQNWYEIEDVVKYTQIILNQIKTNEEQRRRYGTIYTGTKDDAALSLDQNTPTGDPLLAMLPVREDEIGEIIDRIAFLEACRKEEISDLDCKYLYNKFYKGLNDQENASVIGITHKEVRNIARKYNRGRPGFEKLKKIYEKIS